MFDKEILLKVIESKIKGQGNQIDTANVLPNLLTDIVEAMADTMEETKATRDIAGDLATLQTDHKSDIVSAINELFGVLETPEYQITMTQSTAERKKIYDEVMLHPPLAKNIVFFNAGDNIYYRVNGYKISNNILFLNVLMDGGTGTMNSITVKVGSNGSIAI